ncbi:ArfGap-domain-containing protein [Backusella circina FSU 941]|nr:ArfGap-domain-containing protein [Backusella circina FSU 941]
MSTRHQRIADTELNDKHTRILTCLLQQPNNRECADCKKKDPRWASWNLGIFICIRCSGTHRSMGTHISKVKSVDLDTWIPEQVDNMVKWGNERANVYWEANLTNQERPTDHTIDQWIRAKYELKKWAQKGTRPDPSTIEVGYYLYIFICLLTYILDTIDTYTNTSRERGTTREGRARKKGKERKATNQSHC